MIRFVSELYYPEDTSTGFFVTGICEGLAEKFPGSVGVLCAQPGYARKGEQAPARETRNGVEIRRLGAPCGDKNRLPGRIWNLCSLSLRFFLIGLNEVKRGDQVVVVTNPPSLSLLFLWVCRLKRAEISLLVHDVYPDVLIPTGFFRNDQHPLYRMAEFLQRRVLRGMKHLVVLGRDMRDRFVRKDLSLERRIQIIPNWGDPEMIRSETHSKNPLRKRLGLEDKFLIQFSGNLGRTHGLEDLLALAKAYREIAPIHFFVFGWGAGRSVMEQEIQNEQLENITMLPPCEWEELGSYLTCCDLFLMPFREGMEGISVPSRLYNVLAAGNPVLAVASEKSELAQVVREENVGWVVPPGDLDGMKKVVRVAMSDSEGLASMRLNARKALVEKYSRKQVLSQWKALLANERDRPANPISYSRGSAFGENK